MYLSKKEVILMKKKIILILGLVILSASMIGCSKEQAPQKTTISIGGSSSGMLILEPVVNEFNKNHPEYKVSLLPGTETRDGLMGVNDGLLDIGSQARPMKDSEKEEFPDLQEYVYLKDAMVIGVNPENSVTSLTKEQIKKIYSGEIDDWSQVGGAPGKIMVLDREESDSSKILLRQEILGPDMQVTQDAVVLHSAGDLNKAIETNADAIGPSSLGTIKSKDLKIRSLDIDGVVPSVENVINGEYTLVRSYGLTVKKGNSDPLTQMFLDYVFSDEGMKISEEKGYIPLQME